MIPTTRTKCENGTCRKFGRYSTLDASGGILLPYQPHSSLEARRLCLKSELTHGRPTICLHSRDDAKASISLEVSKTCRLLVRLWPAVIPGGPGTAIRLLCRGASVAL